jgi:hypothetical protein
MARGDWSVYGFVRAGIEARARLERVEEERSQLRLHAQRLVHWLNRRLAVLLGVIDDPDSRCFDMNLRTIIIHHYRVTKSLLKADAPLFGPEERALLLTLQRRIIERFDPENIEGVAAERDEDANAVRLEEDGMNREVAAERDEDANSVRSEEDGMNREFNENAVGEFLADQIRNDVEARIERFIADRIMEDVDEEMGINADNGV